MASRLLIKKITKRTWSDKIIFVKYVHLIPIKVISYQLKRLKKLQIFIIRFEKIIMPPAGPAGLYPSQRGQTCTNTRSTSIPPGVLSFQVVFVDKFNLMEYIFLLLFWPVSEGLDLLSGRYM